MSHDGWHAPGPTRRRGGDGSGEEPRRFEDFFGSEHARLFGALCLVTGDRHEAEEIMQDAFLRLWERWEKGSGLDDPSSNLFAGTSFRSSPEWWPQM